METWMLAANEAKRALDGKTFASLEEKVKAAMRATKDHWLCTDEDGRFRAAVGGVLFDATDEEKERIEASLAPLKAIGALSQGIPVNLEQIVNELPENPLKLKVLWDEVKAEA